MHVTWRVTGCGQANNEELKLQRKAAAMAMLKNKTTQKDANVVEEAAKKVMVWF